MAILRGFSFPEDLYYLVDKHIWVRPLPGGLARIGLTPVAYHLLRHSLEAISVKQSQVGQEVPKGKSVAMVESVKYIGPVPAPFTGALVRGNPAVMADPSIAERDSYGEGWIVEMRADDWDIAASGLVTGEAAMKAYRGLLESQNIDLNT